MDYKYGYFIQKEVLGMSQIYEIEIKETLLKVLSIEANSLSDAIDKAMDEYFSQKVILSADDFSEVEFEPVEKSLDKTEKVECEEINKDKRKR